MGFVYADIELLNAHDLEMVNRGYLDKDEVKCIHVNALVDTGSYTLAINENIREILQLRTVDKTKMTLADGNIILCDIVSFVSIKFGNRTCRCDAVVLPGDSEPLLGAIPLEYMDLVIHPKRQELTINPEHGEDGLWKLKSFSRVIVKNRS